MTLEEIAEAPGSGLDLAPVERLWRAGKLTLGRHPYTALPELYGNHDVFVFPAVSETFGHPLAEAMSSGIPVIAADTSVAREVCGDHVLYVRPFHPRAYLEQVMELDANPALRSRLVIGARKHVLSTLRWQDHVDRLVDLFDQMLR